MFTTVVFIILLPLKSDAFMSHDRAEYLVDSRTVDDHDEFELSNIISSSEAYVEEEIDKYTDDDRKLIVDLHNNYRSNITYPIPSAADMNMLEYNKTLEWAAKEYLKVCKFQHGRSPIDNMTDVTTQNLYVGPGGPIRLYLNEWYKEYLDFDHNTLECRPTPPGQKLIMCGHYTAMMWGSMRLVGCGRRTYCSPRGIKSDVLVACHYFPLGNWAPSSLIRQYFYGKPCTKCQRPDGNLCHRNLCVEKRMIQKYKLDYTCQLNCQNCAVPDWKNCRCKCKKGWDYTDCGIPCEDLYMVDPKNTAKPKHRLCPYMVENMTKTRCEGDGRLEIYHIYKCRKACKQCEIPSEKDDPKDLCCGGKICERYSVLNERTCECHRQCPSKGCIYSVSSSSQSSVGSVLFIFISHFVYPLYYRFFLE